MTHGDTESLFKDAFADVTFDRPLSKIVAGAARRRQHRRIALGTVPALGILAAGGTALLDTEVIWGGTVHCFNSVDPATLPFGASSPETTGEAPEKLCAREWRDGYLPGEPYVERSKGPFPVPPLTTCVIAGGEAIGVFPTDEEDFCTTGPVARRMSLSEVPDDYQEHIDRYIAMRDDAAERLREEAVRSGGSEGRACLDESAATALAIDVLADHGYEGWTTRAVHYKQDPPCWMHVNFENGEREVVLYPTGRGVDEIWVNDGAAFPEDQ